jgi:hypothetical protein
LPPCCKSWAGWKLPAGSFTLRRPLPGFTSLWERKRLDLTVEAVILEETKSHPLFTEEEIEICRKRLRGYGYPPE